MGPHRIFLLMALFVAGIVITGCHQSLQPTNATNRKNGETNRHVDPWPTQVTSEASLKKLGLSPVTWFRFKSKHLKIAVGVENRTLFSPSHHVVCGYVYNKGLDGWTRFFASNVESVGEIAVTLDEKSGFVRVLGAANNNLDGKTILSFSTAAISDSAPFEKR